MTALEMLHDVISKQGTAHPDAVFIVAGDFIQSIFKTVFPNTTNVCAFQQGRTTSLTKFTATEKDAYKAVPHPHFGQSDNISLSLYPAYRQHLKQTPPVNKTIKVWNED